MAETYRIFISYRRADSWGWAGRVYDHLCSAFGEDNVFMDVEEIEPGADFIDVILDVVSSSEVALVIIGTKWVTVTNPDGQRRIERHDDVVRREIQKAFSSGSTVIPLLVEGSTMPLKENLPKPLATLAGLNAFEIHPTRFGRDIDALVTRLRTILERIDSEKAKSVEEQIADLERQRQDIDENLRRLRASFRADVAAVENTFYEEITEGRPTVDEKGFAERPYDAFLLYSHAHDAKLASALQRGLQRFSKPWYKVRSLRIFRDATNLSASPDLWNDITSALERSKYIVLLASPESAHSAWVERELHYWLENRSVEQMLLVQSAGEIAWDDDARDFDWTRTSSLPRVLSGTFRECPLYVDMSWVHRSDSISLEDARFRDALASIAAAIKGVEKDELVSDDVHQHRRSTPMVVLALSMIVVLLVAVVAMAFQLFARG